MIRRAWRRLRAERAYWTQIRNGRWLQPKPTDPAPVRYWVDPVGDGSTWSDPAHWEKLGMKSW